LNIVVSINQAPSFTTNTIDKAGAADGVAYSSSIAGDASDPESDPMTFSLVDTNTWLNVAANGDLSGTPGASDVGTNVFIVQVDATGGSDTATLNITVHNAPVGGQVLWSIAGSVGDGDTPDNDNTTTFSATHVSGPDGAAYGASGVGLDASSFDVNGASDINPVDGTDDTWYIRHKQSTKSTTVNYATGYTEFTISADSGYVLNLTSLDFDSARGGTDGIRGFEIFGAADAVPTASDSLLLVPNEAVTVTRDDPLARSIVLSAAEYQGIQSITFRYYPLGDADGNTIEFTNMELNGTVSLDNPPANQAPAFSVDPINEVSATEDVAYSSSIADDASDPDSDPMTFSKVDGPDWLNVSTNGALSGTPAGTNLGANAFTVQVDAEGGSDTATLNITVLSSTPVTNEAVLIANYDFENYLEDSTGEGSPGAKIIPSQHGVPRDGRYFVVGNLLECSRC